MQGGSECRDEDEGPSYVGLSFLGGLGLYLGRIDTFYKNVLQIIVLFVLLPSYL